MTTQNVLVRNKAGKEEKDIMIEFLKDLVRRLEAGEDITVVASARIPGSGGSQIRMIGSVGEVAKAIAAIAAGLSEITKGKES